MGPVVASGLREKIGYGNMNLVIAVLCSITAVCAVLFIDGSEQDINATNDNHDQTLRTF